MQPDQYNKPINAVIDYILVNIDKPLTVSELSKLVNLSPYHFHRIFTQFVGESLAKFVLRKRLELAAIRLQENVERPVMNIAYEVGFNSANVFCRNFKKRFGVTAEEYRDKNGRSNSKNRPLKHNIRTGDRSYSYYLCKRKTFNIGDKIMECTFEIKELPLLHVVYCRHYGEYGKMQDAFAKLMQWAYPRGLVLSAEPKLLAVYHDNPEVTSTDKLTSDACLIVEKPVKPDGVIGCYDLQGGLYAVGRFEITMDEYRDAWNATFKLLEEHGCQCGKGLPYEIYYNNGSEHPEKKWITDICIPVFTK